MKGTILYLIITGCIYAMVFRSCNARKSVPTSVDNNLNIESANRESDTKTIDTKNELQNGEVITSYPTNARRKPKLLKRS